MCIIAIKEAGVDFPPMSTMENCFLANSDGAGFAYAEKKILHYRKGLMTWEEFEKEYHKIQKMDKQIPFVFHFRIGTHGKKRNAVHCHPFPLCDDIKQMEKTKGSAETVVFHNGIISKFGNYAISDTMDFIKNVLSPFSFKLIQSNLRVRRMIENLIGTDKMVFFHASGEISKMGDWIEKDGMFYSNSTYQAWYTDLDYVEKDGVPWEGKLASEYTDTEFEAMGLFPLYKGDKFLNEKNEFERVKKDREFWSDGIDVYSRKCYYVGRLPIR